MGSMSGKAMKAWKEAQAANLRTNQLIREQNQRNVYEQLAEKPETDKETPPQ